jgi:hypothetical protein
MYTVAVYRVEHMEHGRGPFTSLFELPHSLVNDLCDRIGHLRNAVDDLGIQYGEVCGVVTPYGINQWFGYTINGLFEHGYILRCYHVPHEKVRPGENQVAFTKRDAVRVEDVSLARLTEIRRERR